MLKDHSYDLYEQLKMKADNRNKYIKINNKNEKRGS